MQPYLGRGTPTCPQNGPERRRYDLNQIAADTLSDIVSAVNCSRNIFCERLRYGLKISIHHRCGQSQTVQFIKRVVKREADSFPPNIRR